MRFMSGRSISTRPSGYEFPAYHVAQISSVTQSIVANPKPGAGDRFVQQIQSSDAIERGVQQRRRYALLDAVEPERL